MRKSIELRIESVRRLIYQHETKTNPHYDINPEIILHVQTGSEGRHRIKYEVEYISRLDPKWRKWYSKEIDIDIENAISEYRDT